MSPEQTICFHFDSLTTEKTTQNLDKGHVKRRLHESYHFTVWKLSNDEVKAIVLHGESYAFTLWNDSFHFAILYIVILHI